MQNKPNFKKPKMNLTSYMTTNYEDFSLGGRRKNEPKQTQFPMRLRNGTNRQYRLQIMQRTYQVFCLEMPMVCKTKALRPLILQGFTYMGDTGFEPVASRV